MKQAAVTVFVSRKVTAFPDSKPEEHGPTPLARALEEGLLSSSCGTVDVEVRRASDRRVLTYAPSRGGWVPQEAAPSYDTLSEYDTLIYGDEG